MEEDAKPVIDSKVRFTGFALYDEVRLQYFRRFEDALNYFQSNLIYVIEGKTPAKYVANFVSRVCSLYIELEPKLNYMKNSKLTKNLEKMNRYLSSGEFIPDQDINPKMLEKLQGDPEKNIVRLFLEFSTYLRDLRMFLEDNGITRYEQPKYDPAEEVIRGYAR